MQNVSNGSFDGKLSLAAGMRAGYTLDLEADGAAWVPSPQMRPCSHCSGRMELSADLTCFGESGSHYQCGVCGFVLSLEAAEEEQRVAELSAELIRVTESNVRLREACRSHVAKNATLRVDRDKLEKSRDQWQRETISRRAEVEEQSRLKYKLRLQCASLQKRLDAAPTVVTIPREEVVLSLDTKSGRTDRPDVAELDQQETRSVLTIGDYVPEAHRAMIELAVSHGRTGVRSSHRRSRRATG